MSRPHDVQQKPTSPKPEGLSPHPPGHAHEVERPDGTKAMLPHEAAHALGVPEEAPCFVYAEKTGLFAAHEHVNPRGPEALVIRILNRLLQRLKPSDTQGRASKIARPPSGSESSTPQKVAKEGPFRKELNLFEKIFLSRFQEGKPIGARLQKGQLCFGRKPEGEWKGFFQKFLPFTLEKRAKRSDLQTVVYRGLVKMESSLKEARMKRGQEIALLVSDLKFATGKTEKFARIPLEGRAELSQILMRLASLLPGEFLADSLLAEWLGGPEFAYLALSHKIVRPDLARALDNALTESAQARTEGAVVYAREAAKGIALQARTEEIVARELDLNLKRVAPQAELERGEVKGGGGDTTGLGGLFGLFRRRRRGGSTGEEILEPGFVPWFQLVFKPKKIKGRPRWWVPLLYFVVVSSVGLFAVYLFKFLLQR